MKVLARRFTAAAILLLAALTAPAQQAVHRIGYLSTSALEPEPSTLRAFRRALETFGYVDGKNIIVEVRSTEGLHERNTALVAELLGLKVDVLVVGGTPSALAAMRATKTVPIVFASVVDPIAAGIVTSLARPGGNITGSTFWVGGAGFAGKWVELLKEAAPHVSHIAVFSNPANPSNAQQLEEMRAAARALKVRLDVIGAGNPADLDKALATVSKSGAGAMIVAGDPFLTTSRGKLIRFAAEQRLPAVYFNKLFADDGGLIAYGVSLDDLNRKAATYVNRILKGAKPGDLPIEQPTKFELVVNAKTAKALGLDIPRTVLLQADHVIE